MSLELLFWDPTPATVTIVLAGIVIYLVAYRRIQYLDPLVAFSIPWVSILLFSITPISGYAVAISQSTYRLIILALLAALIVSGKRLPDSQKITSWLRAKPSIVQSSLAILALDLVLFSLTALNIGIAGYVPIIRGITTGDTGYLDFGVHGLYGFYLAFANALSGYIHIHTSTLPM